MTAQEYIQSQLKVLSQPVVPEKISEADIEDAIYAKVMSKKFRKFKADDGAVERSKRAIHIAVEANKPLKARMVFGGNKLWRFDEAPEIDWAELFSLMYYVAWMKGIASVYDPGITLELFSQDISVETLNNVPRSETDKYSETMSKMLQWLEPYLPENVAVTYHRHLEEFKDPLEYIEELQEAKTAILKENHGNLPPLSEEQQATAELNVKLLPEQADDPDWQGKVELVHQAIFRTKTLATYLKHPDVVPINAGRFSRLIVLGSTKRSTAKFWAGVGALEKSADSFHELVLTPKQLENATFEWQKVNIEGLQGKNFARIRILVS